METRETITLDARAQQRLLVLTHVLAGELDVGVAAAYLRLSARQVARLCERLRAEGAAGLVHGNRGRRPVNRVDDDLRAAIVDEALTTYAGFNPVHLAETLAETDPAMPSLWGTLQDRLVSELRRGRVATLEEANELLAWYLPRHNRRFTVPAADPEPAWRPWSSELPPEAVLCFEYPRGQPRRHGRLGRRQPGAAAAPRRVLLGRTVAYYRSTSRPSDTPVGQ